VSAIAVTEREFLQQVKQLARLLGWKTYHTWQSVHSDKGWPDLALCRGDRLLLAELKRDGGKLTPAQTEWLSALAHVRVVEAHLWKPASWDAIVLTLQSDRE
jgi:hypothetical protein